MNENNIIFYNEDCRKTIERLKSNNQKVDIILTSPPYNTNKKQGKGRNLKNTLLKKGEKNTLRYDSYIDNIPNEEYIKFSKELFNSFENILSDNGVILYNLSYGAENTECLFLTISEILSETDFTLADVIIWKKPNSIPNCISSNKLTRITEFVFVFCRKSEFLTFYTNKKIVSVRKNGQKMYGNYFNFIEAPNNDGGRCELNKATYSSELCEKLLNFYAKPSATVYDPFMGTGTTAIACEKMGLSCIGSELSKDQVEYSKERLANFRANNPEWLW